MIPLYVEKHYLIEKMCFQIFVTQQLYFLTLIVITSYSIHYTKLYESAGTGSWHIGEPPCDNSIEVAKINGIDISDQRAQQINKILIDEFDLIIALDDKNITDLKRMGANPLKLGDYGYDGDDVPDPYFFPGFEGRNNFVQHTLYEVIRRNS